MSDSGTHTRFLWPLLAVLLCSAGCGTEAHVLPGTPVASLSTTALHFLATTIGSSTSGSALILTNTGQQPLTLEGAVLSDTVDFSMTTTCAGSLAGGATCSYNVLFTPTSVAALEGTLTLTDNSGGDLGTQQVVLLSGTGNPVPTPQALLTVSALDFGQSVLRTPAVTRTVALSNAGTAPLHMGGAGLSDTADFTLVANTCGTSVQAGASCLYTLAFAPQSVGVVQGTFTLTDDTGGLGGAQQIVALTGTGLPIPVPQLVLSSTALLFPSTVPKASAPAQAVTLSNTGSAPLTLSGVALADTADYALATTCGETLQVGMSCGITVTFAPQTTGSLASTLTLTSNSGVASGTVQQVIALSGTGLPVPAPKAVLMPTGLPFGNVNLGSVSAPQTVTLSNNGTVALGIGGVALSDTANFAFTNSCAATLARGASCTLTVVFQPQSAGPLSATLLITDNSGGVNGAQQTLPLGGTGVALTAPEAVLAPEALDFPDTMASLKSPQQVVTLSNIGNAPLLLGAITLSDTQNFSITSNCPASLNPASSCALTLIFQPQTAAPIEATLRVADNSGATGTTGASTAQQTVTMLGNGIPFAGPRAVLAPMALTFPQIVANTSGPGQTVTLTNTGTTPLTVTGVALSGTGASIYGIAHGSCIGVLAPGSACSETVDYSPHVGSGGDTANLVFTDDTLGKPGSTQVVVLTGSALTEVDSADHFGDSITCGYYAMPNDGTGLVWSLEGYAGLFDSALGVPAQSWCRMGDTAADTSRVWVPFHSSPTSTDHQLFTLMVGTNDAYRYGIAPAALATYTAEVTAAASWLAIPNSDKVLANAIAQRTGSWSEDVGFGVMSTDAGASLTFNVNQASAGRNLYLIYHVWALPFGQAGKATIAVDGVVEATVDESQNSGVYLPTQNGTSDTYVAQAVPLGAAGQHTLTFSSAGPGGSSVGLLWAGVAQQDYAQVDGAPEVLLGYVPNSPSGNQTFAADNYSLQLQSLIPALVADGMNVKAVNTSRVMDPASDFVDLLHPNNSGHAKLAAVFESSR